MKKENETYKFIKFVKSDKAGKKYTAILKNKNTGGEKRVHFGATGYENFSDNTGLGLYKGTGDKAQRDRYRARHKGEGDPDNFPNPGYFAYHTLWT